MHAIAYINRTAAGGWNGPIKTFPTKAHRRLLQRYTEQSSGTSHRVHPQIELPNKQPATQSRASRASGQAGPSRRRHLRGRPTLVPLGRVPGGAADGTSSARGAAATPHCATVEAAAIRRTNALPETTIKTAHSCRAKSGRSREQGPNAATRQIRHVRDVRTGTNGDVPACVSAAPPSPPERGAPCTAAALALWIFCNTRCRGAVHPLPIRQGRGAASRMATRMATRGPGPTALQAPLLRRQILSVREKTLREHPLEWVLVRLVPVGT